MVHKWYRANIGEKSVKPLNQRTKYVQEIIKLLEMVSTVFLCINDFYCPAFLRIIN